MSAQRVLIVGPSWVGDMVMTQSLVFYLKTLDQHCQIDVLAPPWALAVVDKMPDVDAGIELPIGHGVFALKQRYQIGRNLRKRGYTRAIVLPSSWKSALIPFFAEIPWRTGYIGECRWGLLNDARKLDKQSLKRTVDRFVALGAEQATSTIAISAPRLQANPDNAQQLRQQFCAGEHQSPVMAICPGAEFGSAKQWPGSHYASIIRHYASCGWAIWLFGSVNDQSVCREIRTMADVECTDFSGQTTIQEAIDLMSLSSIAVSNDSGLMHIAAALEKPLVALYGSSNPVATPPLGDHVLSLSLSLLCSPCFQRECRYGHRNCLTQMQPEFVIEQIDRLCAY
ncbi:MAG TPA: lipopolysaccharide heptosyltransferase II [Crenotrichaceae bacterium]|nr:lipopolysaccharide heptosyltransferase II [Crenotrichaceae bacterium]